MQSQEKVRFKNIDNDLYPFNFDNCSGANGDFIKASESGDNDASKLKIFCKVNTQSKFFPSKNYFLYNLAN